MPGVELRDSTLCYRPTTTRRRAARSRPGCPPGCPPGVSAGNWCRCDRPNPGIPCGRQRPGTAPGANPPVTRALPFVYRGPVRGQGTGDQSDSSAQLGLMCRAGVDRVDTVRDDEQRPVCAGLAVVRKIADPGDPPNPRHCQPRAWPVPPSRVAARRARPWRLTGHRSPETAQDPQLCHSACAICRQSDTEADHERSGSRGLVLLTRWNLVGRGGSGYLAAGVPEDGGERGGVVDRGTPLIVVEVRVHIRVPRPGLRDPLRP